MRGAPTLLAFDTSAAHCAAALLCGNDILAERQDEMGRGQAEHLMPLLEEILAEAGLDWSALDALAVGVGPGNFTGIRIAVSAARGLALGLGVPAVGVSGFEVMAAEEARPCLISLPAPRGTVYLQTIDDGRPGPPRQAPPDAPPAVLALPAGTRVIGAEAHKLALALGGLPAEERRLANIAPRIARIAAARLGATLPRPAPLYVRPADAAPPADPPPVILP